MLLPPSPNGRVEAYWNATSQSRIELCRCEGCAKFTHPPRPMCAHCGGEDLTFSEVSGQGVVIAATETWHAFLPTETREVPYWVFVVELHEQQGLYMIGTSSDEIAIGEPVKADFVPVGDVVVPNFVRRATKSTSSSGDAPS